MYITTFDGNGVFIGNLGNKDYLKDIGKDDPYTIFFSKEQTEVTNDRPHKFVKEQFNYEMPLEIPCNKDFERGDLILDASPYYINYELECWRLLKQIPPVTPINNTAFIRRKFDNFGLEIERFAVIGVGDLDYYYLESEPIFVDAKDRFNFSVDVRWSDADVFTGSGFTRINVAQIRLYAEDGSRYTLDGGTSIQPFPEWVLSASDFSTDNKYFVVEFDQDTDDREWRTARFWEDADCPDIPTAGYITIVLVANSFTDTYETFFSNLVWDYIPYINGSYQKYTGQYNQVTRPTDPEKYKAKRDEIVYMSDSPKPLFKGAMLKLLDIEPLDEVGLILTDNTDFFAADSRINLPGDVTTLFYKGQEVQIKFTTSNDLVIHVISVTYNSGPDTTDIIVVEILVDESNASASFYIPRFTLATTSLIDSSIGAILHDGYYDASVYPDGTDAIIRYYGVLQVYDVWDQFVAEMRIFEATCQGLDLATVDVEGLPGTAHLLYRWTFQDPTLHTDDRLFFLLTFNQNYRNVEWKGTFREVANSGREKSYEGNVFKYISK